MRHVRVKPDIHDKLNRDKEIKGRRRTVAEGGGRRGPHPAHSSGYFTLVELAAEQGPRST